MRLIMRSLQSNSRKPPKKVSLKARSEASSQRSKSDIRSDVAAIDEAEKKSFVDSAPHKSA